MRDTFAVRLLAAVVVVVMPLTIGLSFAENQYIDGLILPFVTQSAREGASFWVYSLGMTSLCVILFMVGSVTERWMRGVGVVLQLSRKPFGHKFLARCCLHYDRFGQAIRICFSLSGIFFAISAWSNHIFFHHARLVDFHSYITVGAFALSVTAMTISTYVTNELVKLLNSTAPPPASPELRAVLLTSKRAKTAATIIINVAMLAHVPTTYIYEWFCAGNLGPHAPRGTTFATFAECEGRLARSTSYCERWRDERNSSMTLLYEPPDDSCPSVGLSLYNAVTEYAVIACLTVFVLTLEIDMRYDPRGATSSRAVGEPHVVQNGAPISEVYSEVSATAAERL